ncbi:MAG: hypothetical protein MUP27_16055 [Desulfobacterales bacterium]|nr:hypothetical protein [Desulfobacterales bacterium]
MRDIEKISEKVEKKKQHLQELFAKDDENYELWDGKEQIFDDHKMAVNITGTEMVALALRVQASIVRSRLDVHVLPPEPLPNPDATDTSNQEERMYYYGFEKANERLLVTGKAALLPATAWQATVLGRIAVRVLVYPDPKTEEIIWDYLPLYPRFFTFDFDSNGLSWGCYETFCSAESIWNEYKVEVKDDGKGISKSDYWDRDHNVRYLTEDKTILPVRYLDDKGKSRTAPAWKHKFGEVPIVFQPVVRSPKAIDSSGIKVTTWGESIFDHVKVPFRKLNMMRSIAATHAHLLAKAPLDVTYTGDKPGIEEKHFDRYPGAVFEHPDTTKISHLDESDIPSSLMAMMGDISTGIKNATYTELNPDTTAHSGAALRILGQDKQDVLTPRMDALNNMYTRICKMVKKQIITQGLTISVQTVIDDKYETYDIKPKLLENDFPVRAELIQRDVYDEEASLQKAQLLMQLRLMPREDVMERIMNEQDVPTQITKMDMEDVEAAIPEMKLKRLAKFWLDKAYNDDGTIKDQDALEKANMIKEMLGLLLVQKQQAAMPSMGGMPGQPGTPTLPGQSPQGGVPGGTAPQGMPPQMPSQAGAV